MLPYKNIEPFFLMEWVNYHNTFDYLIFWVEDSQGMMDAYFLIVFRLYPHFFFRRLKIYQTIQQSENIFS